jgi:SMI1-KNR4 cell-wall
MNYTNFLESRQDRTAAILETNSFEAIVRIKLPPIYKEFYRIFNIDAFKEGVMLKYLSPQNNNIGYFTVSNFNHDDSFVLYNFLSLNDAILYTERVYSHEDLLNKECIYPIGECFNQGTLMLGYGSKNADSIFVEYAHEEKRVFKLADSIFDFLSMYHVEPDIDYIPSLNQLYKNWGEDFWRIRDVEGP